MGYRGETYAINLSQGGFNFDQNIDKIPMTSMVEPTKNINLHKGGRSKRGGTAHVNDTPITDTPRIWGAHQFRLENGTEFLLTATSDGKIQRDYTTTLTTGLTIDRPVHFITFNNLCIICTGNDLPHQWDGAAGSTSALSGTFTDWSGGNYPRKMVKHGRGASERLWAIYGKTRPEQVYASDVNAGDGTTEPDFTDGNVTVFHIDTGDGFGILNGVEYGDRLILAGKKQTYVIDDTDSSIANWGYNETQWKGGTASDRLFIAVTNDIISMDEYGTMFSVVTSQKYGDYIQASLTRTSPEGTPFMDEYIREKLRLLSMDDFHMIYDPVLRQIYLFVVRSGQTEVDTALCYFIDRGPVDGWVIKDNVSSDSGFKASCSTLVRESTGDYKVYTGGYDNGIVWELETAAKNDNGAAYSSGFKTPRGHLGDPRLTKRFDDSRLLVSAEGDYNLFVDVWVDGNYIGQKTVSLAGVGGTYGSAVYGTDIYGGAEVIEVAFTVGRVGKRIEYHVFNNNVDEDYFVSQILTDFKPLGRLTD